MILIPIPVTSEFAFSFVTQLGEVKVSFDFQWNDRSSQFSLTLSNDITKVPYFEGSPVVLDSDLLEPYNYAIGSLIAIDTSNANREATLEDFGQRVVMYWFSEQEKADAQLG